MACFASYRRSGWVRVLVLILCALFIFATIGAPPAHALGVESVAVFGLASVLSAATAALGFKLASNEQGQATLQKMVQDFKTVAWATGFVLVGSKLNGLQNGMDYIKMQVQNGKTYLDERVFAWVQQWLAKNGVYETPTLNNKYEVGGSYSLSPALQYSEVVSYFPSSDVNIFNSIVSKYDLNLNSGIGFELSYAYSSTIGYQYTISVLNDTNFPIHGKVYYSDYMREGNGFYFNPPSNSTMNYSWSERYKFTSAYGTSSFSLEFINGITSSGNNLRSLSNFASFLNSSNSTGLSGTDTLGKDVVDLTLDQILEKLKEWAQDWFDAGADSATNAATGALDLPLTVSAGAATANPSIAEDGPLVWFPPFSVPIPNLRTGETDTKTVDQGKENASSVETSTVDVAENQTVIDSLVNWALSYISPDTGLFSKFPLCVPYDAYLIVCSALGVDAVDPSIVYGAEPADLAGVVTSGTSTYSDFQPIIHLEHDFELDGRTYPLEITIDLTPWQPFVDLAREGIAILFMAELIASEYRRIKGH